MIEWYKKVVFENYANFNGRARRSEYWWFILMNIIISVILNVIGVLIEFPFIGTIYSLAVFLPSIGVAVRRMHDVGKSGWYALIPIYNLILAITEGEQGQNEYGPDPKSNFDEMNEIGKHQE